MIKKEIAFEDFDGKTVTETHYFHLSKAELIRMELAEEGGISNKLTTIVQSGNGAQIIAAFSDIIAAAYGQRVDGSGSEFHKSEKIRENFMGSLAYDALLSELLTNENAAAEFVNGLVPKDLRSTAAEIEAMKKAVVPDPNKVDGPSGTWPDARGLPDSESGLKSPRDEKDNLLPWAFRPETSNELTRMTKAQLLDVMQRRQGSWVPPAVL